MLQVVFFADSAIVKNQTFPACQQTASFSIRLQILGWIPDPLKRSETKGKHTFFMWFNTGYKKINETTRLCSFLKINIFYF